MRKVLNACVVACSTAVVVVPAGAVHGAQDPRAAMEAGNRQFGAHVAKGDGAALAALYTTDAQVLPPNGEPITGRAAIQKFWQGVMDSGVKGAKLTTVEAAAAGDMAHEVGTYELSGADGMVLDSGKYIVIWKRDGGQWKLHRDIWNTSRPAAR